MALLTSLLLLFVCAEASVGTLALNPEGLLTPAQASPANGDVCKDCTQIFELLSDLLLNADLQKITYDTATDKKSVLDQIESFCSHLPGVSAKLCKEEVEKFFPLAITFLTSAVKPSEICKLLGLCKGCEKQEKLLQVFMNEALQAAEVPASSECSFCLLFIKTLESLLPKERTEGAVISLLEEICNILPQSYHSLCQSLVSRISKTVLDAIVSYATPQAICSLLHMCKGQEAPLFDPCTLPAYRCRDSKTAVKCGTWFYCQKYAWKSTNNAF